MNWSTEIYKMRLKARMTREAFAEMEAVSVSTVRNWENGKAEPSEKEAKRLHMLRNHMEKAEPAAPAPDYAALHSWQKFSADLDVEYRQCLEEGLDVREYAPLFEAVQNMPDNDLRAEAAEVLWKITRRAPMLPDYPFVEPSDYEGIALCRDEFSAKLNPPAESEQKSKVEGAWYGRIAGCLLGKTLEGIRREELIPFLKETGNYPMHRYVRSTDITDELADRYQFNFRERCYADTVPYEPADDDTNYTVLYQNLIEQYSRDFTPANAAQAWEAWQPKNAYCTAERIAYCNFVKGYMPPLSGSYQNHYREWIGAQIRADYFGYINPGDPETAAEMAWRDACISHVKNGIYGEMFVAAMLAAAACTQDRKTVIRTGLSQIPAKSRLYAEISEMLEDYENGVSEEAAIEKIVTRYDDRSSHDWCHTISNARIVTACLLYGEGDYARSICLAVQTGFDTDCNGATVGSIIGMMYGIEHIPAEWLEPMHGRLETMILGTGVVEISELTETTLRHIRSK